MEQAVRNDDRRIAVMRRTIVHLLFSVKHSGKACEVPVKE
jgi:hypothetical protein